MDEQKYSVNLKSLHTLLVLSFVVSGIYFLSELVSGLTLPMVAEYYNSHPDAVPDQWGILLERSLSVPQWYYLLSALLDATSIVGLVMMWRLRKNGFHYYTLSKLLLMLMPVLFLDRSFIGIGNIMIGILFIALYFYLLRTLGVFGAEGNNNGADTGNDMQQ
ncbi:MAG: hypothetical protein IJ785_02430 [Bacteroidales bacterium]|nr:hypothetical protein [Bacteroidales bacterium]